MLIYYEDAKSVLKCQDWIGGRLGSGVGWLGGGLNRTFGGAGGKGPMCFCTNKANCLVFLLFCFVYTDSFQATFARLAGPAGADPYPPRGPTDNGASGNRCRGRDAGDPTASPPASGARLRGSPARSTGRSPWCALPPVLRSTAEERCSGTSTQREPVKMPGSVLSQPSIQDLR